MHDPYTPPKAELELGAAAPEHAATDGPLQYAGFWRRFGAYWIDILVWLPVSGLVMWLSSQSRMFHLYWLIPSVAIGIWFHVYLVVRFGGTPGKVLMNMRIAMVDGSSITTEAAIVRYAVLCVLSLLGSVAILIGAMHMDDETYRSLGFVARNRALVEHAPSWNRTVTILVQIWIWSEFISMLFNKKRRAIHDFMAKTVVLRRG